MTPTSFIHSALPEALTKLRPYAIRMAGIQETDDLLQTVALRALENSHQFTPGTSLRNWLHRIMLNEFLGTKRGGKNQLHRHIDALSDSDLGRSGHQETIVFFREVVAAVVRLKPVLRDVMTTYLANDVDASFARGVTSTARAHLSKARLALKEMTA